ncbi:mitochondrial 54S ribosomal protein uL6m [Kwoniella dejecticola CBS 10117]|uniref:50S small subunit ribosomal protein L6 n=1 Tax=Kwoniella dejecticola CBS 10117 TaxID=1296121 RepID=A0A1A5ZXC1_9TREE|nr:50S small subunit ribosomal protein L6 [Kwoniella dejecticola CBS 10117]OBR82456.1 50S small subunit ribosomal protein L6 [Kwoniella dejecticola CBS 10117]
MSFQRSGSKAARSLHTSIARNSHIGKVPIAIPPSVTLTLPPSSIPPNLPATSLQAQRTFTVTGPLGSASVPISPSVILAPPSASAPAITISVHDPTVKAQRSIWGLTRTLINNAVTGVSSGFNLEVRLVGVGYRAAVEPIPPVFLELAKQQNPDSTSSLPQERLNIKLGFAHPVLIDIPPDIKTTVPAPTKIILNGTDKQKLGQFAAKIRQWRRPEPYRGKGIFVGDETIKLKEIKKK